MPSSSHPTNGSNSGSTAQYTRVAVLFHWALALMLLLSFSFGVYMVDLPFSPSRIKQYNWHKWAGMTILALSLLRLLWRLSHRPPAALPAPPLQRFAASFTHGLFYVLFFAVPLMGWAYSSAAGFPVVVYGVIPLPDWVSPNKELADTLKWMHKLLAYSLAAFVLLHVAAALKHHWFDKDRLLHRMSWKKS
jgi:cytochrome b561